jgi:hypothetical protein
MNVKRKGGWQVWVDIYPKYVIKTKKTEKEIKRSIWKHLLINGKIKDLDKVTKKLINDTEKSIEIIKKSKIPKEYLAYPEFLNDGKIKQKKAIILQDVINELYKKGKIKEAKRVIDKFLEFIHKLWEYGIHEWALKFTINFGRINNKTVLIDLFELMDNKKEIEKRIKEKHWIEGKNMYVRYLPKEIVDYYLEQVAKKITIEELNKHWMKKLK